MRFIDIVVSGLESGSYYNEEVRMTLTIWRLTSLDDIQFAPHREQPVLGVKTTVC